MQLPESTEAVPRILGSFFDGDETECRPNQEVRWSESVKARGVEGSRRSDARWGLVALTNHAFSYLDFN